VTEKPTRTPSEKIAPEVFAAAVEILDVEGPDGFTVRNIAQRASVAHMAIYNHFSGVNGLLEVLWINGFETLSRDLTFVTDDPDEDIKNAALAYRRFSINNRGLYTVMFLHRFRNFEPSLNASYVAAHAFEIMVNNVERCQASGSFRDIDSRDAAQILWSACHGFVALELLNINFAMNRDETFASMLTLLQQGYR
jgi:AcrR family transcriptional regulator